MTALEEYEKLEAPARYFDGRSAAPIEVAISFGERSLMIVGMDDHAISHWPLASLKALGAPGDTTVQLLPDLESDERIVLTDAEMISALRRVCPELHGRPVNRRGLRRGAVWGMATIAILGLILFVLIPRLADQLAEFVPPESERALGDAVAEQFVGVLSENGASPPLFCNTDDGLDALSRMARRMTPKHGLPYPIKVSVLDHEMVNAVALPGGRILIFRGLIDAAESPEEVASVLAHEIGHVINRDPTRGVLRAAGTAGIIGIFLGDFFGATVVAAASDAVLNASHQREAEALADETALAILADQKLPAHPFAQFFERLRAEDGELGGPLKYLASHPGLAGRAARAAAADTIGDQPFIPVLDDRGWIALQNICDEGITGD